MNRNKLDIQRVINEACMKFRAHLREGIRKGNLARALECAYFGYLYGLDDTDLRLNTIVAEYGASIVGYDRVVSFYTSCGFISRVIQRPPAMTNIVVLELTLSKQDQRLFICPVVDDGKPYPHVRAFAHWCTDNIDSNNIINKRWFNNLKGFHK